MAHKLPLYKMVLIIMNTITYYTHAVRMIMTEQKRAETARVSERTLGSGSEARRLMKWVWSGGGVQLTAHGLQGVSEGVGGCGQEAVCSRRRKASRG